MDGLQGVLLLLGYQETDFAEASGQKKVLCIIHGEKSLALTHQFHLVGRLGTPPGHSHRRGPDRDGQYFHYLGMWLFALDRLGRVKPAHRQKAVELARQIHPRFVLPGLGVYWKMQEDLIPRFSPKTIKNPIKACG